LIFIDYPPSPSLNGWISWPHRRFLRHGFHLRDRTAADIAILRKLAKIGSCRLAIDCAILAIADLHKQPFFTHAGKVAARHPDVG
jgi:hypothetical protein